MVEHLNQTFDLRDDQELAVRTSGYSGQNGLTGQRSHIIYLEPFPQVYIAMVRLKPPYRAYTHYGFVYLEDMAPSITSYDKSSQIP